MLPEALTKFLGRWKEIQHRSARAGAAQGTRGHCCSFPGMERAATYLTIASDRDLNNSIPVNPHKLVNTASSYLEIFHYLGVSNKLIERQSQRSSANHASQQQHQVVSNKPPWPKESPRSIHIRQFPVLLSIYLPDNPSPSS